MKDWETVSCVAKFFELYWSKIIRNVASSSREGRDEGSSVWKNKISLELKQRKERVVFSDVFTFSRPSMSSSEEQIENALLVKFRMYITYNSHNLIENKMLARILFAAS